MLHLLPISIVAIYTTTFIITYSVTRHLGHSSEYLPFISDTGAYPPESCIFDLGVSFAAFLSLIFCYLNYVHKLNTFGSLSPTHPILRLNKSSLILGFIGIFGILISAYFQTVNVFIVHSLGSFIGFGGQALFTLCESTRSYYTQPALNSIKLAHLRLATSILAIIAYLNNTIFSLLVRFYYDASDETEESYENAGWKFYITGSTNEWCYFLLLSLFLLTYVKEFRKLSVGHPEIKIYDVSKPPRINEKENDAGELSPILSPK